MPPQATKPGPWANFEWTEERDRLLGRQSDRALARQFGIPVTAVRLHRAQLGIPPIQTPATPSVPIPVDLRLQLGKKSDCALSRHYGIPRELIRRARVFAGIPATPAPAKPIPQELPAFLYTACTGFRMPKTTWAEQNDILLGTMSDRALGKYLGIRTDGVRERRLKLGISPCFPRRALRFNAQQSALLGKSPDTVLAKKFGISRRTVARARRKAGISAYRGERGPRIAWTPALIRQLGRRPDREIALQLHCANETVWKRRRTLKIPGFRGPRIAWTPALVRQLGRRPDREIALHLHCGLSTIRQRRYKLKISRFLRAPKSGSVARPPRCSLQPTTKANAGAGHQRKPLGLGLALAKNPPGGPS